MVDISISHEKITYLKRNKASMESEKKRLDDAIEKDAEIKHSMLLNTFTADKKRGVLVYDEGEGDSFRKKLSDNLHISISKTNTEIAKEINKENALVRDVITIVEENYDDKELENNEELNNDEKTETL